MEKCTLKPTILNKIVYFWNLKNDYITFTKDSNMGYDQNNTK